MISALSGFVTIFVIVMVGYLLARNPNFGPPAQQTLAQLAYLVGTPAMLILLVSDANIRQLFSVYLLVFLGAVVITAALFLALTWRRFKGPERMIGYLAATYCNAGNLGIPVSIFILGDAAWVAPILLIQVSLLQPLALLIIDTQRARESGQKVKIATFLGLIVKNPLIIASAIGLALNLLEVSIPETLAVPLDHLAALAVPLMLIPFGMALRHSGIPKPREMTSTAVLAAIAKSLVMPAVAWLLAWLFQLSLVETRAAVVFAALPAAQLVLVHAIRYDTARDFARHTVFVTTVAAVPILIAVATIFEQLGL